METLSQIGNIFAPLWNWLYDFLAARPRGFVILLGLVLAAAAFGVGIWGNRQIDAAFSSTVLAWALRLVGGYLLITWIGNNHFLGQPAADPKGFRLLLLAAIALFYLIFYLTKKAPGTLLNALLHLAACLCLAVLASTKYKHWYIVILLVYGAAEFLMFLFIAEMRYEKPTPTAQDGYRDTIFDSVKKGYLARTGAVGKFLAHNTFQDMYVSDEMGDDFELTLEKALALVPEKVRLRNSVLLGNFAYDLADKLNKGSNTNKYVISDGKLSDIYADVCAGAHLAASRKHRAELDKLEEDTVRQVTERVTEMWRNAFANTAGLRLGRSGQPRLDAYIDAIDSSTSNCLSRLDLQIGLWEAGDTVAANLMATAYVRQMLFLARDADITEKDIDTLNLAYRDIQEIPFRESTLYAVRMTRIACAVGDRLDGDPVTVNTEVMLEVNARLFLRNHDGWARTMLDSAELFEHLGPATVFVDAAMAIYVAMEQSGARGYSDRPARERLAWCCLCAALLGRHETLADALADAGTLYRDADARQAEMFEAVQNYLDGDRKPAFETFLAAFDAREDEMYRALVEHVTGEKLPSARVAPAQRADAPAEAPAPPTESMAAPEESAQQGSAASRRAKRSSAWNPSEDDLDELFRDL